MDSTNTERDIWALISMLDEPDLGTYHSIAGKIYAYGPRALPFLEARLDQETDGCFRDRANEIADDIRQDILAGTLLRCMQEDAGDELLTAWISVSKMGYPLLDEQYIFREVESIRRDVWLEMNDNLTALEQVKVFNHVFYTLHRFSGNMDDYHHPDNSFINRVLERRTGTPLSIGILYMLIARRVNLPISGINLPEHFVLAYVGETIDTETLLMRDNVPLFYINAFSQGSLFSIKEANDFLKKLNLEPLPAYFEPCSKKDIVLRMLSNLVAAYGFMGEVKKKERVKKLRDRLGYHR